MSDFLVLELEVAMKFVALALAAKTSDTRERARQQAIDAEHAIERFIPQLSRSAVEDLRRIGNSLTELRLAIATIPA